MPPASGVAVRVAVAVTLLSPLWLFSLFPFRRTAPRTSTTRGSRSGCSVSRPTSCAPSSSGTWRRFRTGSRTSASPRSSPVLPPPWAEKLLLTAYVVSLPLSFRYALVGVRPAAAPLAWLSVPFVLNRHLHEGFYNRAFALVPFFLALGFYVRRRGALSARPALALALLVLWVYFCTSGSFVFLLVVLALLAAAFTLEDVTAGPAPGGRRARPTPRPRRGPSALALFLRFQIQQHPERTGIPPGFLERARYLLGLYDLVVFDMWEAWIAAAFAILLGAALVVVARARWKESGWHAEDTLLVTALVFAGLYFAAPQVSVPGVRSEPTHLRLSLHVLLAFVLWIAQGLRGRAARLVLAGALAAGLALTAVRLPYYSPARRPGGRSALPGPRRPARGDLPGPQLRPRGRRRIAAAPAGRLDDRPLRHAGDRVATERDLVSMDDYQADTQHFPLRFRAGANAHELLQSRLDSPGCVRIARFNRLAPRPIDFVLVWRRDLAPPMPAPGPRCARWTPRTAAFGSPRGGHAELLERRGE